MTRVVYILGPGHCGSTLLSLLLNGHPQCVAVGELSKLDAAIANHEAVLDRPEWRAALQACESFGALQLGHPGMRELVRWSPERIAAWARPRKALLDALVEATGRPIVVDASKSWQQLYLMQRSQLFDLHVIDLVRDAHGVVHSYTKKYGELTHGLSKWMKSRVAAIALARRFDGRWLRVRYEELGTDTLARICDFIGVPYDPHMLHFRSQPWIGIGSNRMSRGDDETIRIDDRWQRDMPLRDRVLVTLASGFLNRMAR